MVSIAEQQLLDAIEGFDPNIKIGTTLDEAGLTDVFQALIDSGEMTVQQVEMQKALEKKSPDKMDSWEKRWSGFC